MNKFIVTQPNGFQVVDQDKLIASIRGRDLDTTKIYARLEHLPRHTGRVMAVADAAIAAADRANGSATHPDAASVFRGQAEIIRKQRAAIESLYSQVAGLVEQRTQRDAEISRLTGVVKRLQDKCEQYFKNWLDSNTGGQNASGPAYLRGA